MKYRILIFFEVISFFSLSLNSGGQNYKDPDLLWATYFGSNETDNGHAIVSDIKGNLIITGSTTSASGLATTGAFQQTNGGNSDIILAKFTNTGILVWSTFFGGAGEDGGNAITLDKSGNIYITGYVSSINGIVTTGAYQTGFGAYRDAVIAKFSPDGKRIWATYFGGTGEDRGYGICVDPSGNIVVTGFTSSGNGIASRSAYRPIKNGDDDIFIAKFDPAGTLFWSTYFGGDGKDRGNAICTDASGNIYVSGISGSKSKMSTSGAYQPGFKGTTTDAFLAKFSPSGNFYWCTYFGGYSASHAVVSDPSGNIYIAGDAADAIDIASSGAFQTAYGGMNDAYLAKFNKNGQKLWSTYFGGKGNDLGIGLILDDSANVLMTGVTSTDSSLADSISYQVKNSGADDVFLVQFNPAGQKMWSTFYGGTAADIGYGMVTDHYGNVFVTGQSSSDSGISTRGAQQEKNQGNANAFIAKFGHRYINDGGIYRFFSPDSNVCPGEYPVIVSLKNFGSHSIDSVKIDWSFNGQMQSGYYWRGRLLPDSTVSVKLGDYYFHSGSASMKAWTYHPNGLKDSATYNDTSRQDIQVYNIPPATAGPDTTLCYNEEYTMKGAGGIIYRWIPAVHLSSSIDPHAKAVLQNVQHYILVVTNEHGCSDTSEVLLKVRSRLKVTASSESLTACFGTTDTLWATALGGDSLHYAFHWIDDSLNGAKVIPKLIQSGWHRVVLSDNCSPANDTDSVYIRVIPPAKAAFDFTPKTIQKIRHPVNFTNHSQNASGYLWNFDPLDTSKNTKDISPKFIFQDTGIFKIRLVAYGLEGCYNDTAWHDIEIIDGKIKIYVPNAFSPDGNRLNDRFEIRATGIVSYSYVIYNRWGEMIFLSSDLTTFEKLSNLLWDGTFKGSPVVEGVYLYMLDVVDIDGEHHYLKGNVTILK